MEDTHEPTAQPRAAEEVAPGSAAAEPRDHERCVGLLPRVSRTFALSIELLPATLGDAVRLAYLACRIIDTIEDDPGLAPELRAELLGDFGRVLSDGRRAPETFARRCAAHFQGPSAEAELARHSDAVLRCFRRLPAAQRRAIAPWVVEMAHGMREYGSRARGPGGARITDLADLERYCYFVAGTVGRLLTALFEGAVPELSAAGRLAVRERAVTFGLGLQLVNIVKDVASDFARGDCFLPQALAAHHDLPLDRLLDPNARPQALRVVGVLCSRAREHLARAEEYTTLWPSPAGDAVRLFCAVPLALALATLNEVETGHDAVRAGAVPKVSRTLVAGLVAEARSAVSSDAALRALIARYRSPAPVTAEEVAS